MTFYPEFDFSGAVNYHYDQFPPSELDYNRLAKPLGNAAEALGRYDQMLKGMHNSEILLGPLRRKEAVDSSRIEGTISTLEEVLRYEAAQEENDGEGATGQHKDDTIEVFLYNSALGKAQQRIEQGAPLSAFLLKDTHEVLLSFGRGANSSPGKFKTGQNYLGEKDKNKVLFVPMRPEQLQDGIDRLFTFIESDNQHILIKTALSHLEFEALHPFMDGNGRIGRMLITLMLWKYRALSAPHFYISNYFEERRDEYIDRMREVSKSGAWTEWVIFFLKAVENRAQKNLTTVENIQKLYEEMKVMFHDILRSSHSMKALDFLFSHPLFLGNVFTNIEKTGIPKPTAQRFLPLLVKNNLLKIMMPGSGSRPTLYRFEPLLEIVSK